MDPTEMTAIFRELVKMDPTLNDADYTEQYRRCYEVYNKLQDWESYALTELVDPVTYKHKWYWRRKS